MPFIEPQLPFDQAAPGDVLAAARLMGADAAARFFDVPAARFKKAHTAARAAVVINRPDSAPDRHNYSIFDCDAALRKIISMLEPILDPAAPTPNSSEMRNIIETGHDLVREYRSVAKELKDFDDTRRLIAQIIDAIQPSPDADAIFDRLYADSRLKALAR